jgi:cyclopropane-fatty-acyl-phospholipid synthase
MPASAFLGQLYFPGSLLSPHADHIAAAEQAGFKIIHDAIGDYRPTLKAWYDRLAANQDRAIAIVGLEVYNRYMTFFPNSWTFFHYNESALHRMVMEKP